MHGTWCVGVTETFLHSTLRDPRHTTRHVNVLFNRFTHDSHVRVFCLARREALHLRIEVHSWRPCTTGVLVPRVRIVVWIDDTGHLFFSSIVM